MNRMQDELVADDMLDESLATDDTDDLEDPRAKPYVPDPRLLWGSEAARAMLVVLTRRFGPEFAREVSDEIASRTLSYQAGCPDDRRDGDQMQELLCDGFWDELFAMNGSGVKQAAE